MNDLFDAPGSSRPRLRRRTLPDDPIETHRGKAAEVRLYSWGSPGDDRYSLNVVLIVDGSRTGGMTFSGASFAELREVAAEMYARPPSAGGAAVLRDVERCLVKATKQLSLPMLLPAALAQAAVRSGRRR